MDTSKQMFKMTAKKTKRSLTLYKIMRISFALFILILSTLILAKDSVELAFRYFPNTDLLIENKSTYDMEMYFDGDESLLPENLKGRLPLLINGKSTSRHIIKSGDSTNDGNFPIEMIVDANRKYASINGSEIEELADSRILEGVKIIGNVSSDGGMKFISSEGANKEFDEIIETIFSQLGNNSLLSSETVRVGETISKSIPLEVPINVGVEMNFNMEIKYKLNSIEGNIAHFDVDYDAIVGSKVRSTTMDADVTGSGKMTYDIKNRYSPEDISKTVTKFRIPMHGGALKIISGSNTNSTFTILKEEPDENLKDNIIGLWSSKTSSGDLYIDGTEHYKDDGYLYSKGKVYVSNELTEEYNIKSKWRVKFGRSYIEVVETSNEEFLPVGHKWSDKVINVDVKEFTYEKDDGEQNTMLRIK